MKKITEKQKERHFLARRNENYRESLRLDGHDLPLVTLDASETEQQIQQLRARYER
ncbi:YhfG family protein [Biostraticola tofi]|uniref:Uncharacterized protein DUF2559 n=1 Tax=Biostraticola tofi TaxID=466109 RepID=A0A4R3YLI2_9GAMM|nr:YhfG family protein [Biostraticola tofi]TCV93645.1 uncharacterized protein DUF2559 [Biostraticola tofi]